MPYLVLTWQNFALWLLGPLCWAYLVHLIYGRLWSRVSGLGFSLIGSLDLAGICGCVAGLVDLQGQWRL